MRKDLHYIRSKWKVVAEPWKTLGFLASGGEEFNLGPVMRLDCSELLYNKVLYKYKSDNQSFWHKHQKGAERVPPCWSSAGCYIATSSLLMKERNVLKLITCQLRQAKMSPDFTKFSCRTTSLQVEKLCSMGSGLHTLAASSLCQGQSSKRGLCVICLCI